MDLGCRACFQGLTADGPAGGSSVAGKQSPTVGLGLSSPREAELFPVTSEKGDSILPSGAQE